MSEPESNSGIYKITNAENGKIYVGSAVNFKSRWRNHLYRLRKGNHHSQKLQNSWSKHDEDNFQFSIIELVSVHENLITREQFWIDELRPFYNSRPNASSQLGFKHSPSTLVKMAVAGASISEETRAKMRAAKLGRPASKETRELMSAIRKGRPVHSVETRSKLAELARGNKNCLGKRHSPEACAKISAARKGVPLSKEHREKLSKAHMGKIPSVISYGMLGKKHSEETKEKMSASQKRRFVKEIT